jgi:hypothetical protein
MKTLAWLTTAVGTIFLLSGCATSNSSLYNGTISGSIQRSQAARDLSLESIRLQLVAFPEAQHKRHLRFTVQEGDHTKRMIVKSKLPQVGPSQNGQFVFNVSDFPAAWYIIAAQSDKMKFPMFLGDSEHRLKLVRLDTVTDRTTSVDLGDLVLLSPFARATFELKVGEEFPISFEGYAVQ